MRDEGRGVEGEGVTARALGILGARASTNCNFAQHPSGRSPARSRASWHRALRERMNRGEGGALSDSQKLQVVVGNCFQKAVELDPDNEDAQKALGDAQRAVRSGDGLVSIWPMKDWGQPSC